MPTARAARWGLPALLLLTFVLRSLATGQPIVENYVGRQIPTAMVARNLARGSGFLRPQLDVAPLPNLFLVEPPLYASAVAAVSRLSGWPLTNCGRLVSAFGMTLAAWGLFGLAARREGTAVALAAVAALAVFPVTLRYGRAFQPDALMLGLLLAGARCWDGPSRFGRLLGVLVLSAALALKLISAYVLMPLCRVRYADRPPPGPDPAEVRTADPTKTARRPHRPSVIATSAILIATLLPAFLWYLHAYRTLDAAASRAASDNTSIWLRVLLPEALLRAETYVNIARFLLFRAFTPLGPPLALIGLLIRPRPSAIWWIWGASAFAAMLAVAAKLHHEYYWLSMAPVIAVGVGRSCVLLARRSRLAAVALGLIFAAMCGGLSASTWRTPAEWQSLDEAAADVLEATPPDALVVAPEALLFQADRKGCRLEFTASAARRAAAEWPEPEAVGDPAGLVEFYRRRGATFFADVRPASLGRDRVALHDFVRRRYNVVRDHSGVLIARLTGPTPLDGNSPHGGQPAETPRGRTDDPRDDP